MITSAQVFVAFVVTTALPIAPVHLLLPAKKNKGFRP